MKRIFFALIVNFFVGQSYANEKENFGSLAQMQNDVLDSLLDNNTEEIFFLHNVAIRTRIELEVEVPWIAKLSIKPEIELHWTR